MTKRTEETRATEEAVSRKRKDVDVLDINKKHGKCRRMKKLKHSVEEDDWGCELKDLESIELLEIARSRFLNSNLKEAMIPTKHNSQTTIRIWSWLEIAALEVLKAMMNEVVDIVTEKEELENIRANLIWTAGQRKRNLQKTGLT